MPECNKKGERFTHPPPATPRRFKGLNYYVPEYPLRREPVTVGDWVWIGAGAFVCPGVTIGDGAVIGARSVVAGDVQPWTVVAGNPAKPIKKRKLDGIAPE
jgi:acetyltransferase-like isoleucine patch superfamily enzyme